MQSVCDRVGIIREGRLVKVEGIETLMAQPFRSLRLRFDKMPADGAFGYDGVRELSRVEDSVFLEVTQNLPAVMREAAKLDIVDIETQPVTLEEVFLAYYGRNNRKGHSAGHKNGGPNV